MFCQILCSISVQLEGRQKAEFTSVQNGNDVLLLRFLKKLKLIFPGVVDYDLGFLL